MIVTKTDEGWEIINQQAHGRLAVQLVYTGRLRSRHNAIQDAPVDVREWTFREDK